MQTLSRRSLTRLALAAAAALALAGCGSTGLTGGEDFGAGPSTAATPEATPPANVIGQGSTKIGLLLPLTGAGNVAAVGTSMENAARLAVSEFNNPGIQVIVEDTGGTADGARAAAQQALSQGAELILGPVFASGVSAASQVARQSSVPVIAFSTDANVAGPGVYLLSFLPKSDVNRIVAYAAAQGRKSFIALLPDSAYGTVAQGAFQEIVPRVGGRVLAIERYGRGNRAQMQAAVKRVAASASQADAILLPDAGDTVPTLVSMLAAAGVDTHRLLLMGTGQWNDPRILQAPAMAGGVFPAPEAAGFQAFSQRYRTRFGSAPVRTATLAYDAVLLAAALTQTQGPDRFSQRVLTNPSGFQGIDGVFRFRANGINERGLAVLQIGGGGTRVASPAPKSFAGASGVGL